MKEDEGGAEGGGAEEFPKKFKIESAFNGKDVEDEVAGKLIVLTEGFSGGCTVVGWKSACFFILKIFSLLFFRESGTVTPPSLA